MQRISQSNVGNTPMKRVLGHNPAILEAWLALEKQLFGHPTLGSDLLEQVRRASAQGLQCRY
jgi:alkylhydroperoxidase family enzyme